MSSQWSEPGRRTCGFNNLRSLTMSCSSEEPLGQSVPRLMGWSGSPSTCTTCGVTFFALSPMVWMMTPQLTEQYGQVLRVSVVREIFSDDACACSGVRSKPSTEKPIAPVTPVLTNVRRDTFITQSSMDAGQTEIWGERIRKGGAELRRREIALRGSRPWNL